MEAGLCWPGCRVHVYGNAPAFGTVTVALPLAGTVTSNAPSWAVTVCGMSSLLVTVMGWPTLAASSAGLYWNWSIVIAPPACAWAVDSPPGATPTAVTARPKATTRPAMSIVIFRMVPGYPGPKCPERTGAGLSTDGGLGTPKGTIAAARTSPGG